MNTNRDNRGKFISVAAAEILQKADETSAIAVMLQKKAEKLIEAENEPPAWLKSLILALAVEVGVTVEEFSSRIKIVHPTPTDPVLLLDGKTVLCWV